MSEEPAVQLHSPIMCGGASQAIPGSSIGDNQHAVEADAFVRSKVPEVAHSTLISYRTQVVAGTLYHFKYEGYEGDIKVSHRPWQNLMEISLPNGTRISNL